MKNQKTIIVAGIIRSGLTATMQMLDKGGYPCLGKFPGFEEYPIGEVPWRECEGKAVKLIDSHRQLPPKGQYHVIRLARDIDEQVKSHIKFMKLMGLHVRPERDWNALKINIVRDYQIIDEWASKQVKSIIVNFENFIKDPLTTALFIKSEFDISLDCEAAASAIVDRDPKCLDDFLEAQFEIQNTGKNGLIKTIDDIDTSNDYGKLLMAAIAKITTESQTDKTPDQVIQQLNDLSSKMYENEKIH